MKRRLLGLMPLLLLGAGTLFAQSVSSTDKAKSALDKGDYATAETLYRKALTSEPHSPELLTDLGIALQMQGRSTAAIHLFEQALAVKQLPRTYALLAEERCRSRDLDGARPMLARILKDDSGDPLILALVAPCYLDLDEPIEAVQVYTALLAAPAFPQDLALIQLSKAYLLAAQFFFARLAAAPGHAPYVQAIDDARAQKSPDARGAFAEAAKSSPYFQPDLSYMDAVGRWRQHPDDIALLYLLSVLSSEQSIDQVQACLDRFPGSPYLDQLRYDMLAEQGHDAEAAQGYEALLRAHPEISGLEYSLGMLYRKQRMWEKAAAIFRTELARDPQDERCAARLSEALEQMRQWGELRDFLTPRMNQGNPPLWATLDLAEALENLGGAQQAVHLLAAAEKTNPANKTIHFRLIRLYRHLGNTAQAQAESRWLQTLSATSAR